VSDIERGDSPLTTGNGPYQPPEQPYTDEQVAPYLSDHVEEVRIARLQPGDVVLVKVFAEADSETIEYIHVMLEGTFPDNKIIILEGVDIEVVRPECEHGHIRTFSSDTCVMCGERYGLAPPAPLTADPAMIIDREIS
jgi:hypothetical protein